MKKNIINLLGIHFLLFSTFSCINVEKEKIKESIKPSVPSSPVKIEQTILPSILPSVVSTHTPITTETAESEKIYPPLPEKFKDPLSTHNITGFVHDLNSNSIENANVVAELIKLNSPYEFKLETKTDKTGAFNFSTYPYLSFNFKATKEGYTTRSHSDHSRDSSNNTILIIHINKSPEINEVYFNKKKLLYLYPYYSDKNYNKSFEEYSKSNFEKYSKNNSIPNYFYSHDHIYLVQEYVTDESIILKNINNLDIELKFNTNVNKQTFENNLIIQNMSESKDFFSKDSKNITLNWLEESKKVKISLILKKSMIDTKYKLFFKEPFQDLDGNKYLESRSINLINSSLIQSSNFIIFKVEGEK